MYCSVSVFESFYLNGCMFIMLYIMAIQCMYAAVPGYVTMGHNMYVCLH